MKKITSYKTSIVKILETPKKSLNDLDTSIKIFEKKFSNEKTKNINELKETIQQIKENCLKDEKIIESCNLYTTEISNLNNISILKTYVEKQNDIKAKIDELDKERKNLYSSQKNDFTKTKQQRGLVPAILDFFEKEMPDDVIIELLISYLKELKE